MQAAIAFVLEIEKLKAVTRKVKPLYADRYENSAEHSWQLCLFAYALEPYAAAPVGMDRVIRMLLVHDVGEIDTGDTMVYVEGGWAERKQEELAAVRRICGLLPASQASELIELWQEFEAGRTADARFANAVDRAMPSLLNLSSGGQSWKENGIRHEQVVARLQRQIEDGCPALWAYIAERLEAARALGYFGA